MAPVTYSLDELEPQLRPNLQGNTARLEFFTRIQPEGITDMLGYLLSEQPNLPCNRLSS